MRLISVPGRVAQIEGIAHYARAGLPRRSKFVCGLAAFALFLIVFHLTLVRGLGLSAFSWKIVDYIWLGFAALGLFSAAAQVRTLAATSQIDMFQQRAANGLSILRYVIRPGPGVCRTFTRAPNSPPQEEFERVQREYNQACEWLDHLGSIIPREVPTPPKLISAASLPGRPDASIGDLKNMIDGVYEQLEFYNRDVEALLVVYNAKQPSHFEDQLIYLGPFLLALALALRITKVTGEIKLARS
jgi:hypothetical protein